MSGTAVVIITHNSESEIGPCLERLTGEIVVVDNASGDGTAAVVRQHGGVRLLENPWNRGFAAAANQGIAATEAGCVLLLNPDARVAGGVEELAAECGQGGVAAAGGKLLGADGRPQLGFMVRRFPTPLTLMFEVLGLNRIWPGNPVNRRYRCLDLDPTVAAEVEQPAGAFLMVRREAWRRLGGFDEGFRPLWFEDVDFLKRAAGAGYRVRYVPAAVAVHTGGHSAKRLEWRDKELCWYGNLLAYAARHFGRGSVAAVSLAVVLGSFFRGVVAMARRGSLRPVGVYARVVRVAACYLFGGAREGPKLSSAFAVQ